MDTLAKIPEEFNFLENPAKSFIIPARQNQFIQRNTFENAPVRRIAFAMNTNSAYTGPYTENPIWYQQFYRRQIRTLRGGQLNLDFEAADNCHLYFTTMKAMNFQGDNFKEQSVLLFDLTSVQDAAEDHRYRKVVGEPLGLELMFAFPLEHVTEFIVLGKRLGSVAADTFAAVGKIA